MNILCLGKCLFSALTYDNLTLRAAVQTSQTIFRRHPPQPRLLRSSEDTKIKSHLILIIPINALQFCRQHELLQGKTATLPSCRHYGWHVLSVGNTLVLLVLPASSTLIFETI